MHRKKADFDPQGAKTPEPILMKLGMVDHVRDPTKVVMWGGVPDVVNHAKFHQNWFRGFCPLGVEIRLFPMHSAMAYITA